MIDPTTETLITFAALARGLPRRRRGKPVHTSTIYRWRHPGLRGVQLEAVRIGGAWTTSLEAFSRFCSRLTAEANGSAAPDAPPAPRAEPAEADDRLEADGW